MKSYREVKKLKIIFLDAKKGAAFKSKMQKDAKKGGEISIKNIKDAKKGVGKDVAALVLCPRTAHSLCRNLLTTFAA